MASESQSVLLTGLEHIYIYIDNQILIKSIHAVDVDRVYAESAGDVQLISLMSRQRPGDHFLSLGSTFVTQVIICEKGKA